MTQTAVLEVLIVARALQEAGRCQGSLATRPGEYGSQQVRAVFDKRADHFCLLGALQQAADHLDLPRGMALQTLALLDGRAEQRDSLDAVDYNDRGAHTDDEVLSLSDEAAALVNPK